MDSTIEDGRSFQGDSIEAHTGVHLFGGSRDGVLETAMSLLEPVQGDKSSAGGRRFIILARTLPAAVRLREMLAPTALFDEAGLPITHHLDGRVALYRSHSPAPRRRLLIDEHASGRVPGLILTPDDLAAVGTIDALAALGPAIWLVDDAQCLTMASSDFLPAYRRLTSVRARGLARTLWLFAPGARAAVTAELVELFGLSAESIHIEAVAFPESVNVTVQLEPEVIHDRNLLDAALRRFLVTGVKPRGVLVAPLHGPGVLPPAELESVIEAIGAEAVREPGENSEAQAEGWAALYRRPEGILLTENPEGMDILAPGRAGLVLRLVAPEAPEMILEECLRLARQGGGHWAYFGPVNPVLPPELDLEVIERLGRWLAEASGAEQRPVPIDAQELARVLEVPVTGGLGMFAEALERALGLLVGADFLAEVRPARFQLEVAESHRFSAPHIDNDARYVALKGRYEAALARMGMLQSVRYRLNALPPKDLRVLSGFLEYPVSELNVLFDDLAREGFIICRQVVNGDSGNLNFEAIGQGSREAMLAQLPEVLERISARRARVQAERAAVARLVEAGGDTLAALSVELGAEQGMVAGGQVAGWKPRPVPTSSQSPVERAAGAAVGGQTSDTHASVPPGDAGAASSEPRPEVSAAPVVSAPVVSVPVFAASVVSAPVSTPAVAAASSVVRPPSALERVEQFLLNEVGSLDDAGFAAVAALAEGLRGQSGMPSILSRLEEAASGGDLRARTLQILLLELTDEGEAAAHALLQWIEAAPTSVRDAWLPTLLNGVDYRFEVEGAVRVGGIPEVVRQVALLLPVAETLPGPEVLALVQRSGFEGTVEVGELGSGVVLHEGRRYALHRQGTPPETEARLWLAVETLGSAAIAPEVARARVTEGYLMVAGLAEEELTRLLAERVLAGIDTSIWMGAERQALALGRVLLMSGRAEEALATLGAIPSGSPLGLEAARIRAEAQLKRDQPLPALQTLLAAGVVAGRGEGQTLWQNVTGALTKISDANPTCETCPLLHTEFCPTAESFWAFIDQNPFNEGRRPLRQRIEKRGRFGLEIEAPGRLNFLIERFGGRWDEALLQRWIEQAPGGRAEEWLTLAQRLVDEGSLSAGLKAAGRAQALGDPARLVMGLARVRLAAGDLAGGLELGLQAETSNARGWDAGGFSRELTTRLGKHWEERVEALSAELTPEVAGFLGRLAEGVRSRVALLASRQRLEAAVKSAPWSELREALAAFCGVVGEAAEKESIVKDAVARITERERRLQARVDQLLASPLLVPARNELSRLTDEAEQLGMTELAARAREALAAPLPELPPSEATPPERRPIQPVRREEPQVKGRVIEPRRADAPMPPAREGRGREVRAEGEPREARSREVRPVQVRPEAAKRPGEQLPKRPGEQAAKRPGEQAPREGARDTSHRAPDLFEEPAILSALKEARGDRERVSVVMPAVYEWLAVEPDRGIKLLRDALPLFQFQSALDRPMAEVIREGRPEDGALTRLRRVLEKDGRSFVGALVELSSREHPEPWKRVLGQLKLKG